MRLLAATVATVATLVLAPAASAAFGFLPGSAGFEAGALKQGGAPESRAGIHPDAIEIELHRTMAGQLGDGDLRDLDLELPAGFLVNPSPIKSCSAAAFRTPRVSPFEASLSGESCPEGSQVGVVAVRSSYGGGTSRHFGVFNVDPPYGSPLALGFAPYGVPIVFAAHVREADAGIDLELDDLSQAYDFQAFELTIWGTPWQHSHDAQRGNCLAEPTGGSHGSCQVPGFTPQGLEGATKSVLTLPTSCDGPMRWRATARSWQGAVATTEVESHDSEGQPLPIEACKNAATKAHVRLTTANAASGTGLVFDLDVDDGGGILNPGGIARPAIRRAHVELPPGLTINPSLGNGLQVCTQADFAREGVGIPLGLGCPNSSKIGTIEVEGMFGLSEDVEAILGSSEDLVGALYVAKAYENPFGSLLAVYMVASDPRRGLFVKATGRVELDPGSGRIGITFEDLPRLLYTHFGLRFREGLRPAMVSPPTCGTYSMQMDLRAWGRPSVLLQDSDAFAIAGGERGGPCPAGAPPFRPGSRAGSLNPQAGAHSTFLLNLTRSDADQEITSYSAQLPPGLLGKIAGVPFCADAAIEAAKTRTGIEELRQPSCPAASSIGRTLSGYGVGSVLAYAPGGLYLAGPYRGAPLSVVAIDSALIGPFDLGTVVVRSAIQVDPRSAQVTIDSAASDPIPHILRGIPLHLRDIRVYIDRPGFILNPTSCDPLTILSRLTGAGSDLFSSGDDVLATSSQRFQVFDCAALGFKPKLTLALRGGVKRGRYPTLHATYVPRPGDANIASAAVTLPPSLFLVQEHVKDICTRPQAEAGSCPPASVVGRASAETPLLAEPLDGPVYLRSSSNPLPDLVAELRGGGHRVLLEGRVDSHRRGLRGTFEGLPDAPVSRFTMTIFGGRKRGILVNSENLCRSPQHGIARLLGHNNSGDASRPRLAVKCPKRRKADRGRGSRGPGGGRR